MLALLVTTALNVADFRPAGQHTPKDTDHDRLPLLSVAVSLLMLLYAMAVAKASSTESSSQSAGANGTTVLTAARRASSSIVVIAACFFTVSSLVLAVPVVAFGTHTNVWSYSAAFGVIVTVLPETLVQTILLPTGQGLKSKPLRKGAHRQSVDRGMASLLGRSRVSPHAELARSARVSIMHKRMDTHKVTFFSSINVCSTSFVLIGLFGATIGIPWAAACSLCAQVFLPGTLTLAFGGSAAVFFSDSDEEVIRQPRSSDTASSSRCGRLGIARAKAALVRLVRWALSKVDKFQQRTMWLRYSFPRTPRHIKAAFKREIRAAGIRSNVLYILSLSAPITIFSIAVPVATCLATAWDSPGVVLDLTDSYSFHALCCMAQLSGMVVTLYFGTQYDSALFRAAINAAESEKDNSTSLLRWLSHECRSPVAAAALAVDEIVQEDLPALRKLLLLLPPSGEQVAAAAGGQRPPPQLRSQQAFARLASSVHMVQQPIKSLASVLDNMLQYLRRQRKQPAIEQLLYVNVAQAWRTAWTNACASRDVEASAISDVQPQVYFSGPAPGPRLGAAQVLSGADALQQLRQLQAITSVSQATLLQVLTNYATNALKYGHGGAASARIELWVSVHHGMGGGGRSGVHASHMRAARGWLTQTLRRDWRKQQQQQHAPGVPPPMPVALSALSAVGQASDGLVSSSCSFTTGSSQRSLFAGRTSHAVILPRRRVAAPLGSQGSAVQLQDAADAGATAVDAGTSDVPLLSPAVIDVSIVDHGAGLDAAELESLFHPFARLDSGAAAAGNGLGLWLMRQLVESQGGTVSAHSGGKATGCRFSLAFPALLPVPHRQRSGSGTRGGVLVDAVMSGGGTHMSHGWAGATGGDEGGGGLFGDGEGGAVIRHSHSCPQMPEPDNGASTLVSVGAAPLGSVVVSIPSHVPLAQPLGKSPRNSSSADRRLSVLRALYEESESKSDSSNPSGGATSESNAVEYTSAHTCTSAASSSTARPAKLQAYSHDDSRKHDACSSTAQPLRVLLVEDAVSIRTMLQRQLKRLGHTVDVAFDGRDGLDKWLRAARDGRHTAYDAVVTDMTMPRMNGDEMVRQIHLVCAEAAVAGAAGVDGAEAEVPRAPSPPPHHTSTGSVSGIQEGDSNEARQEAPDTLHVPLLIGVTGNVLPEDISHFKRCGARVVLTKPASGRDVHEVLISAAANA